MLMICFRSGLCYNNINNMKTKEDHDAPETKSRRRSSRTTENVAAKLTKIEEMKTTTQAINTPANQSPKVKYNFSISDIML